MFKVTSITLNRAEGKKNECLSVITHSFHDAQNTLISWGHTAPPKGNGYHKVDFLIQWEDGQTYSGRYDMIFGGRDSSGNYLNQHVLSHLTHCFKRDQNQEEDVKNFIGTHELS